MSTLVLGLGNPILSDDGVGFDPAMARQQGGLGLQGMEERATQLGARLLLQSQPGRGTQVRVELNRGPLVESVA